LVCTPDSEPQPRGAQSVQDCDTENRLPATSGVARSKPKTKPEKGMKIKYIPKQKAAV